MRNVFLMPAGGGADGHYRDTIKRKRTLAEVERFVTKRDLEALQNTYHGKDFAVWGSRPSGKGNWLKMKPGDLIVFVKSGTLILVGEISKFDEMRIRALGRLERRPQDSPLMMFVRGRHRLKVPA
jgi:hypothetical protein